jgi:hypothetical protein
MRCGISAPSDDVAGRLLEDVDVASAPFKPGLPDIARHVMGRQMM